MKIQLVSFSPLFFPSYRTDQVLVHMWRSVMSVLARCLAVLCIKKHKVRLSNYLLHHQLMTVNLDVYGIVPSNKQTKMFSVETLNIKYNAALLL